MCGAPHVHAVGLSLGPLKLAVTTVCPTSKQQLRQLPTRPVSSQLLALPHCSQRSFVCSMSLVSGNYKAFGYLKVGAR